MQNYVKRIVKGSRDQLYEILGPLHILGTVEARNYKLGTQICH